MEDKVVGVNQSWKSEGVLLALTSFYQLMCLLGELVNAAFALSGKEIKQNLCFALMSPYLLADTTPEETRILDVCSRQYFFRHMVMRLWIYVGIASIPAMAYAVLILSMAIAEMVSKGTNPKQTSQRHGQIREADNREEIRLNED
ncbi:hypothetical protein ANCDUO_22771 [Ancylostoma duodenale]|uniref:Uncharacterized protein n=1 Tax=Ancylostoma duodenale TaxID=51022 RepID=A0A0C2BTD6_9BILA|nr:hypothetical protein ANCDUO_22771 [Ancylostoma duodenale]